MTDNMSDKTGIRTDLDRTKTPILTGLLHRKADASPLPSSHDLLRYWNSMRSGLNLPFRNDIDPRAISELLPYTFILEQIAPGVARFRVAGSHLAAVMGMDVRGMPLSACILPDARGELSTSLEQVFAEGAVLRAMITSPSNMRAPELGGELLILPLRDEMGEVTRAIGCLISRGQIGQTPRRFAFSELRVDPVETGDHMSAPAIVPAARSLPRVEAPVAAASTAKPDRPAYLRLVVSN